MGSLLRFARSIKNVWPLAWWETLLLAVPLVTGLTWLLGRLMGK